MSESYPRYLQVVEPEYEGLEEYTEVQEEGISTSWLGRIVGVIVLAVALILVVVYQYINFERNAANDKLSTGYVYAEQAKHLERVEQKLKQYAVVDAANGKYQIPVDRAVELILREAKNRPVTPKVEN
ncbi:MAG TPA: hypothetical protein PLL64_14445 [Rhodothermales bacterium]|nr:hypothetical protein [Rhodothermales bacterium]HRR07393.1 hypothetical protein [Rhodothermales bacterium]